MYEIYINDRPLRLISLEDVANLGTLPSTSLLARYTGKAKTLLQYIDTLEKASQRVLEIYVYTPDIAQLWSDFSGQFKLVAAAGGLVELQQSGRYLFIYRRGYLDLPKGKIDFGETPSAAALREVQEETGLQSLQILKRKLPEGQVAHHTTYHTYRDGQGRRVLKPTYWYYMRSEQADLVPQIEEDIEWARYLSFEEALSGSLPFYASLKALIQEIARP